MAKAIAACREDSMPSARIVALVRSTSASTPLTVRATTRSGRFWISERSSLITSGRTRGIMARLAGSAPTSSMAIPTPLARATNAA